MFWRGKRSIQIVSAQMVFLALVSILFVDFPSAMSIEQIKSFATTGIGGWSWGVREGIKLFPDVTFGLSIILPFSGVWAL